MGVRLPKFPPREWFDSDAEHMEHCIAMLERARAHNLKEGSVVKGIITIILVALIAILAACDSTTEPPIDPEIAYLEANGFDVAATLALREEIRNYKPAAYKLSIEPCDYVPTYAGDFNQLKRTGLLANVVNNLWGGVDPVSFPDGSDWYVQAWSTHLTGLPNPNERGMQWQWQPIRKPIHTDGWLRIRWRRSNSPTVEDEAEGYGEPLNGVDGITQLGMIGIFASLNASDAAGTTTAYVGENDIYGSYWAIISWDEPDGTSNRLDIEYMPWDKSYIGSNADCSGLERIYWRHPDSDPDS